MKTVLEPWLGAAAVGSLVVGFAQPIPQGPQWNMVMEDALVNISLDTTNGRALCYQSTPL